jgi:uncharacterized protein (TIGR00299 family) protein
MPETRLAIIDPAAGIAGDMLLGALLDVGAPQEWLLGLPARLGVPQVGIEITRTDRNGVGATKVTVRLPGGHSELPSEPHQGPAAKGLHPDHEHSHGPHRKVADLIEVVERADLSPWVRHRARQALEMIGEAEGRVHGRPAEEVTLHEVGALDVLVDIVGGVEGFEQLGIRRIHSLPVALGSGWVQSAHGTIPVPAPATGLLVEGLEVAADGPVVGEATTPTGAALLRVLSCGAPPAGWRAVRSGWGAGTRNPTGYANALRLFLAEAAVEAETVVTLATDLDDLSPEYVEPLRQALFDAGALDVQVWGTAMKKGRPGFRIEAQAAQDRADAVTEAFFRHSPTAGVRFWSAKRVTLPRRQVSVGTTTGTARVKLVEGPDGVRAKPEYDDVVALARAERKPAYEVAADLRHRALRLEPEDRERRPNVTNKES